MTGRVAPGDCHDEKDRSISIEGRQAVKLPDEFRSAGTTVSIPKKARPRILHESVAPGNMGFQFVLYAIPANRPRVKLRSPGRRLPQTTRHPPQEGIQRTRGPAHHFHLPDPGLGQPALPHDQESRRRRVARFHRNRAGRRERGRRRGGFPGGAPARSRGLSIHPSRFAAHRRHQPFQTGNRRRDHRQDPETTSGPIARSLRSTTGIRVCRK